MVSEKYISAVKLNLNLHIVGVNDVGYHLLEGVSVFADYGDAIQIEVNHNAKRDDLRILGRYAPPLLLEDSQKNLIIQATQLMRRYKEFPYLTLSLRKNIPLQAGYGGGSGNAARILKSINDLFSLEIPDADLYKMAVQLGADVPMCLYAKPCLVQNIGDAITPLKVMGKTVACLLFKPNHISASTQDIFQALLEKNNPAMDMVDDLVFWAIHHGRNDLLPVTLQLYPQLGDYLRALHDTNPIIARMSGSGSGLFALYDNDTKMDAAYSVLYEKFPNDFLEKTHIYL